MWILLKADEHGNSIRIVHNINELMDEPEESYGVKAFGTERWFIEHPDTSYWQNGDAILLNAEVVTPLSVTAKWALPPGTVPA